MSQDQDGEMNPVCTETNIPELELRSRGKVRDIYAYGDETLILVATDRISAYDSVLPDGIPNKGKVLTQISRYWFDKVSEWMPHHCISTDLQSLPIQFCDRSREVLDGRTMICRYTEPVPIECVVRGYLAGSAWAEYQKTGKVCGLSLPPGLPANARLQTPIFTPATKATTGHDINITYEEAENRIGRELAARLRESSLRIYSYARELTEPLGLILSDTKFEFGLLGGEPLLIDELLTPDSSRYWDKETYREGHTPHSFDKQFIRDYLTSIGWNREPPPPSLSREVIASTAERYLRTYEIVTGQALPV